VSTLVLNTFQCNKTLLNSAAIFVSSEIHYYVTEIGIQCATCQIDLHPYFLPQRVWLEIGTEITIHFIKLKLKLIDQYEK